MGLLLISATDEHDDYLRSVEEHCPNAIHILDRFHLMRHFEDALNETRKLLLKMLPQPTVRQLAKGKFQKESFATSSSRGTKSEQQKRKATWNR